MDRLPYCLAPTVFILMMCAVLGSCVSPRVQSIDRIRSVPVLPASTGSVGQDAAIEPPKSATPGIAELYDWRLPRTIIQRPTRVAVVTNTYAANAPVKCWIEKVSFHHAGKQMHHAVAIKVVVSADTTDYYLTNVDHPDVEPSWDGGIIVPKSAIQWSWTIGRRPFFEKVFQRLDSSRHSLTTEVRYANFDDSASEDRTSRFTVDNYWQPNRPPCVNIVADIGLVNRSTMAVFLRVFPNDVPGTGTLSEVASWMAWTMAERHCIAQATSGPCGRN